jgi:hypothetical protein
MQSLVPFKRGDTLQLGCISKDVAGEPEDLTNIIIRSQVRRAGTRLAPEPVFVAELQVAKSNQSTHKGEFSLTALPAVTKLWEAGTEDKPVLHVVDIEKEVGGVVVSSETFAIPVIKDVTHAT